MFNRSKYVAIFSGETTKHILHTSDVTSLVMGDKHYLRVDQIDFTLFEFSAKYDPVPSMLTQNHVAIIKGFMGQTTGFKRDVIKKSIIIMGEVEGTPLVKYIHGNYGKGTCTPLVDAGAYKVQLENKDIIQFGQTLVRVNINKDGVVTCQDIQVDARGGANTRPMIDITYP